MIATARVSEKRSGVHEGNFRSYLKRERFFSEMKPGISLEEILTSRAILTSCFSRIESARRASLLSCTTRQTVSQKPAVIRLRKKGIAITLWLGSQLIAVCSARWYRTMEQPHAIVHSCAHSYVRNGYL